MSRRARIAKLEATMHQGGVAYTTPVGTVGMTPDEVRDALIAGIYLDLNSEQLETLLSATGASDGSRLHELAQMLSDPDGKLRPLPHRLDCSPLAEREDRRLNPERWPVMSV